MDFSNFSESSDGSFQASKFKASGKKKKVQRKRSKNGCNSCRRLRIKVCTKWIDMTKVFDNVHDTNSAQCDEDKPSCEYCVSTNRECVYPEAEDGTRGDGKEAKTVDMTKVLTMYEDFDHELILNATTKLMNITNFELRLLNFFNSYCIPLFSFNINKVVDHTWRNCVPLLFAQSSLVRQAIYLFSSINMWPLCNFQRILNEDLLQDEHSNFGLVRSGMNSSALAQSLALEDLGSHGDLSDSLYYRTSQYFMETLGNSGGALNQQMPEGEKIVDKSRAAELVVSGILIFSFLGIHPHQLIPLVSFDDDESGTDFLSICKGIRDVLIAGYDSLMTTDFHGILPKRNLILPENTSIIIRALRLQLVEYYDEKVVDSKSTSEFESFAGAIDRLELHLSKSIQMNYPNLMYGWILTLSDHLHDMVKQKHFFALRLLNCFACMCCITGFNLYNKRNIWIDYMRMFKDYNFSCFDDWCYDYDHKLYSVIVDDGYMVPFMHYNTMGQFDPEALYTGT